MSASRLSLTASSKTMAFAGARTPSGGVRDEEGEVDRSTGLTVAVLPAPGAVCEDVAGLVIRASVPHPETRTGNCRPRGDNKSRPHLILYVDNCPCGPDGEPPEYRNEDPVAAHAR